MRLCHCTLISDARAARPGCHSGTCQWPLQPGPAPGHGKGRRVRKQPAFKFPRHLTCGAQAEPECEQPPAGRPDYATAHLGGAS